MGKFRRVSWGQKGIGFRQVQVQTWGSFRVEIPGELHT